jgi:hypothetical protein
VALSVNCRRSSSHCRSFCIFCFMVFLSCSWEFSLVSVLTCVAAWKRLARSCSDCAAIAAAQGQARTCGEVRARTHAG